MLIIWDSSFHLFFTPSNLWDNKKRRCDFIFSDIFSYYTYFTILKFKMEVHLPGEFKVIFSLFFVLFCVFFVLFLCFFRSFLLTRPYFIRICTFLSKTVVFSSIWKFLVLFHIIQFYHDSRVPFNCPFPYFLPFLLGILFRTFSVPFN